MKKLQTIHLNIFFRRKQNRVFSYSDWLVLVHASCHTEAQSHSHFLMEDHHLHIVIVLQKGKVDRMMKKSHS